MWPRRLAYRRPLQSPLLLCLDARPSDTRAVVCLPSAPRWVVSLCVHAFSLTRDGPSSRCGLSPAYCAVCFASYAALLYRQAGSLLFSRSVLGGAVFRFSSRLLLRSHVTSSPRLGLSPSLPPSSPVSTPSTHTAAFLSPLHWLSPRHTAPLVPLPSSPLLDSSRLPLCPPPRLYPMPCHLCPCSLRPPLWSWVGSGPFLSGGVED